MRFSYRLVYRAADTRDEKRIYVACITASNSWLLLEIARRERWDDERKRGSFAHWHESLTGEKTRKRMKRKKGKFAGTLARQSVRVLFLSLSLSCGSHVHVTRVTMGTGRRFKSLRIHDVNKSSVLYVRFVNSALSFRVELCANEAEESPKKNYTPSCLHNF